MKTKIATALSIAGVLSAGSAAALVNTRILDSGPTASGASNAVLPPASSIELAVPEIQPLIAATTLPATSTTSLPDTTTSSTTTIVQPAVAATPAPQASGYLTAFNVGEAGVVTVDVVDGQLVLVKAEPKPGWSLTKAEDDSNDGTEALENQVEVVFTSPTVRVQFQADFTDGQIVPHVESQAIPIPTTAPAAPAANPAPVTTAAHHDDDDDEHEHEHEHDDEGGERDDD